jgi:oxygen-independent coproporphyrinogen-3 oxidase
MSARVFFPQADVQVGVPASAAFRGLRHLYLHVPFCDGKCHYCGFYSVVDPADARTHYAAQVGREAELLGCEGAVFQTLYIGGGTPGVLGAKGLFHLAQALRERGLLNGVEEWTVELNPATVDAERLDVLRASGVTRISLGAQILDDTVLKQIGRRHDAAAVERAIDAVREAGFDNYGLDLIAGLPGVTELVWRDTLDRAIALGCAHLSVYGLGIEPKTVLMEQVRNGLSVPDADAQLDALAVAEQVLTACGFERYEISNYARPGRACRHNCAVWRGADYLGLGPSAASRVGRTRWTNRADLDAWQAAIRSDRLPPRENEEVLTEEDDALERFVFGVRLNEGVSPSDFVRHHPVLAPRVAAWETGFGRLVTQGIAERIPASEGRWRLTARGREVADAVIRELL